MAISKIGTNGLDQTGDLELGATGNVGIGTASPAQKLDVNGTIRNRDGNYVGAVGSTNNNAFYGGEDYLTGGGLIMYGSNHSGSPNVIKFVNSGYTERMRIDSSGRSAISTSTNGVTIDAYAALKVENSLGTTTGNPWENSVLTVKGAAAMAQGVGGLISLEGNYITANSASANFAWIKGAKTNATSGNATGDLILGARGGNIRFSLDSTNSGLTSESMRIDSSGNVLVGKTTTSTTTAGVQLIPNGTAAFTFDTTGDGPLTQFIDPNASTPNGFRFLSFRWGASPTEIGTITKSSASAVAYNTTSDYRLKENVTPMTGALDKVAQLKPVTYTWKADGSDGQGFIAHELQAVVPDCVTGEKDAVDEEGNPQYQGIDTSFLVATLTAAIQELSAKVAELEAKVK
jgi:hypothetical protein